MIAADGAEGRSRITIRGAVQGVGFRPFVYRVAHELGLRGWVSNSASGVFIEVEGSDAARQSFHTRLLREAPPRASIHSLERVELDSIGLEGFTIRDSESIGMASTVVMPDIATCADCLRELFDPHDRRFRYPFTNCTHCGPRYSIIDAIPYDRANTTMQRFTMCARCRREYDDPRDRRFHAQPNACSDCGPKLELLDPSGAPLSVADDALHETARAIRCGMIVAVKGLGGFHLVVDARNEEVVRRLRERKRREEKPLALMVASLEQARTLCEVSTMEESLLSSPEAPIVLLRRHRPESVATSVAQGNPYFGLMLPYTPLHHLLLSELGFPIVATSGNLSDEPICTENSEALDRLGAIADLFLVHDRPILRRVDDSIIRVIADRPMILRRARGFAPLPIRLPNPMPRVLAVGPHQKCTTAIAIDHNVFPSQHLGDLETPQAFDAFRESIDGFERLYGFRADAVACDLHPDYASTRHAEKMTPAPIRVQHHYAHVLSCMAENELAPPVLGVSWDGTGYGLDGTIWGGEFLRVNGTDFERVNHLRTFRLPGGAKAVREPRRSALGVLFELFGERIPMDFGFSQRELETLFQVLRKGVNSPVTSSAGRLFDAAAAMIGLRSRSSFEGQAAMELEFAVEPCDDVYDGASVDWASIVMGVLADVRRGVSLGRIAARFHNSLTETIVDAAKEVGDEQVVLTGGCFQNKYLAERTIARLKENGFHPYWHQRVPPNDGGIALGQIVAVARRNGNVPGRAR